MNHPLLHRRHLLGAAGAAAASGLLGGSALPLLAAGNDYRAVVVIHLNGGNDGNNLLIPTDAAYNDYQAARVNLALRKATLVNLPGTAIGHTFGLHPSLAPLAGLYGSRRLAFIANVGPLVEPTTAAAVLNRSAKLPPFLLSHNDQAAMVQGWGAAEDASGWVGRSLELLDPALRQPLAAVTMDGNRTLVLGKRTPVSFMPPGGTRNWGTADLANPNTVSAQSLMSMSRWQSVNHYEAEYARTMNNALNDSTRMVKAFAAAREPSADFGTDYLGVQLRSLASVLPVFKAQGYKRQAFLLHWGAFDTHANQRGAGMTTQDTQFGVLAQALAAFDATNQANGMDSQVLTLVISEFGRTLRPGSGGGSEHAWGNHWLALGGPVMGGTVYGSFPTLTVGGPDDGDNGLNGRFVPTTSSDQVGAAAVKWLGLPASKLVEVMPNLANFSVKALPMLQA